MNSSEECSIKDSNLPKYEEFDTIFDACGMSSDVAETLLKNIYSKGYSTPQLIQQQSIVPIIKGNNTIAQAQSGQGKTAAFTIGVLGRLLMKPIKQKVIRAMIIAPSREIAIQIQCEFDMLGKDSGILSKLCIGGTSVFKDIDMLKTGKYTIIVGTIGRIKDLMSSERRDRRELHRTHFRPKSVEMLILDEFDAVLDGSGNGSFDENVKWILNHVNQSVQICMFSATVPEPTRELATFMRNPSVVLLDDDKVPLKGIKQFAVDLTEDAPPSKIFAFKAGTLIDIIGSLNVPKIIAFVNTKKCCEDLSQVLQEEGYQNLSLTGDMSQSEREKALNNFKTDDTTILIATNLIARGIDIQQIGLVINFDLPKPTDDGMASYIHRIGRSGRMGRKGFSVSFIGNNNDQYFIERLEHTYSCVVEPLPSDYMNVIQM